MYTTACQALELSRFRRPPYCLLLILPIVDLLQSNVVASYFVEQDGSIVDATDEKELKWWRLLRSYETQELIDDTSTESIFRSLTRYWHFVCAARLATQPGPRTFYTRAPLPEVLIRVLLKQPQSLLDSISGYAVTIISLPCRTTQVSDEFCQQAHFLLGTVAILQGPGFGF